ncbi:hypothetical protein QEH52_04330 [Coraliomargarita sp. SDUM461003]|uniref:Lipoprotein n=1 Tax=Thalassobacterium maritimum TaxID=3041265 RepID=A0ABU1ARD4_9BACT|nr:hypothetical protein [Coraliomargarita sp. SDUM461003]MDQ8206723.1 hypothetical protein [Coraliomargarita sp. SDUM461003]
MKTFLIIFCTLYWVACSQEKSKTSHTENEVEHHPIFVSENRQIEAWIYEKGYDADKPWKSRYVTKLQGHGELTLSGFVGQPGTEYQVRIMSPGRARYSLYFKESETERSYSLWGLPQKEALPREIPMQDEKIAILEGRVNTKGEPDLVGPNTEYFRYAIAHGGIPQWIGVDYQGRQSEPGTNWIIGDKLYLDCFRRAKDIGIVKIPDASFHSKRIDDDMDWKNVSIELKAGDSYFFKTHFGKYMGVFRVVSVDYFTDEKIQIFRTHKRN